MTARAWQGLSDTAPTLAIVASTFMWGTLWIPLRQMNAAGLGEATASTASFALCLLLLLPFALLRWRRGPVVGQGHAGPADDRAPLCGN